MSDTNGSDQHNTHGVPDEGTEADTASGGSPDENPPVTTDEDGTPIENPSGG
ncbi:hypothetical protein KZX37_08600 [Microbacterium sp. EYE_5]|uniref:hypothetical protein n=1 Tax=unclassified Microbacterium TaxID=2609290 RepID=UPI002003C2B3|nr:MULTISPECIES: hypothetical protein [unclassified Microbacterium]MCK6081427.1 hypothetical protein [Microbacterium sp. EYE_382]MCK6086697.1 hypothetical protein [Microbacterium sp. EYE_384]MCK6123805.1 hypothetical protein [Microbacterium sp. EYE_80]MCK6126714.1 hypothetical protein [Microbacterium sp. EYE_79]MCK6142382.1 hypothetical protein [Microbacterium sp. EYE_39]